MTLLKKTILAPFAVVALAVSVQAVAAPINHTIAVEATVPSSTFYVNVDGDWDTKTQVLKYNMASDTFSPVSNNFKVKNTAGGINARLLDTPVLADQAGSGAQIPLEIKFNNKILTAAVTPQEVLTATEAASESARVLSIAAEKSGAYTAGTYTGNVQLSFDAVAP